MLGKWESGTTGACTVVGQEQRGTETNRVGAVGAGTWPFLCSQKCAVPSSAPWAAVSQGQSAQSPAPGLFPLFLLIEHSLEVFDLFSRTH